MREDCSTCKCDLTDAEMSRGICDDCADNRVEDELGELPARLKATEAQRDELLAVCEAVVDELEQWP